MRRLIAVLFAAALMLAGCADSSVSDTSGSSAEAGGDTATGDEGAGGAEVAATITISDFAYGDPVTVEPGALIRVVNEDSARHDADAKDGTFDNELLGQGEELTFNAPDAEGTYDLICSNHPQMAGQLIVAA